MPVWKKLIWIDTAEALLPHHTKKSNHRGGSTMKKALCLILTLALLLGATGALAAGKLNVV